MHFATPPKRKVAEFCETVLDDNDVACVNFNMTSTRETMVGLGAEMEDLRKISDAMTRNYWDIPEDGEFINMTKQDGKQRVDLHEDEEHGDVDKYRSSSSLSSS